MIERDPVADPWRGAHRPGLTVCLLLLLGPATGCGDSESTSVGTAHASRELTRNEKMAIQQAQSTLGLNPREAYDILSPILEGDAPPPKAQLIAGLAANAMKRHTEAIERMQDAVDRDPTLWPSMAPLGSVYLGMGQIDQARDVFESVLKRAPGQARAQLGLGQAALELGNATTALEHLDLALKRNPKLTSARFHRARALHMNGQTHDAFEEVDRVLKVNPTHAKALYLKAQLLTKTGRTKEAADVLRHRSEVYELRENVESMIAHTQAGGGDASTYVKIIQILLRLEDRKEAELALRAGTARFPGDAALQMLADELRRP